MDHGVEGREAATREPSGGVVDEGKAKGGSMKPLPPEGEVPGAEAAGALSSVAALRASLPLMEGREMWSALEKLHFLVARFCALGLLETEALEGESMTGVELGLSGEEPEGARSDEMPADEGKPLPRRARSSLSCLSSSLCSSSSVGIEYA